MFSPSLLNTARLGFSRASFFFTGSTPVDVPGWVTGEPIGAIVISGSTASNGASAISLAGLNVGSNNETTRNLYTVDDHVYWSRGKHQVEGGFWLQRIESNDLLAQYSIWTGLVCHLGDVSAGDGEDIHGGSFADGAGMEIGGKRGIH